ncbi:MAG: adenylate/guanylate cyclase domain-containing protein [Dehalococcoidia bacterium]
MTAAPAAAGSITGAAVFTDLVGFTEFTALEGDDRAFELLATQERLVRARLTPGARIVKELGDGLFLWFPDAREALCVALELHDDFEVASDDTGLPLWARVGVHWGSQRPRGEDLVGHDVNVAARIMQAAGPGEVLASASTAARAGDAPRNWMAQEIGPVVMKGIPDPIPLVRLERAPSSGPFS